MSRWHQDPPDDDQFSEKPEDAQDALPDDVDLPEGFGTPEVVFVAPEAFVSGVDMGHGQSWSVAIDPAEHAAHAVVDALSTLELEIAKTQDFERAMALRKLVQRVWQHLTAVSERAAAKCDEIVERRR